MGNPVLLLRLEGPLQSWGVRSRWDVRDTAPEPTKSGIVGLLGCALGFTRGDMRLENELDAGLRFGVRIEAPGRVLRDFQTISDFLPMADGKYKAGNSTGKALEKLNADPDAEPATIISPRSYLEDAAFLVGLEEREGFPELLQKCYRALQSPLWPLYLGRKACVPTRPILDTLTDEYQGLEDALARHPWSWLEMGMQSRSCPLQTLAGFVESDQGKAHQDAVRINPARQYGFRYAEPIPPVPCTSSEGDAG